ncbi:hypothetical protein JHK84_050772 [Glycine max]|nr:hypothetical protein JHK84_050772 [Glycine max]
MSLMNTLTFRVNHGEDSYTTLPRIDPFVECKELFYRHLPKLHDSIADNLLPGCTTVEQRLLSFNLDVDVDVEQPE